jgi:hypothetical protein
VSAQADLIELGFPAPFLSFPKGATTGAFENTIPFTPETLADLNSKNLVVGGETIKWEFMEGDALRGHYVTRANFQAKKALEAAVEMAEKAAQEERRSGSGSGGGRGRGGGRGGAGRGGRGGDRGGRGGSRGGGRGGKKNDRSRENEEKKAAASERVSLTFAFLLFFLVRLLEG